ncbi:hypothetical protein AVEN_47550-1 [Araneus ventricosus]|uniref:Uncharacterized protein n=1 Tax=Araneus ventricosus TaxID=182803 RepID=A0A4Y2H3Q4_ARAVE|nr:hypothetical protein AVEN_47550-1 [Araneus ventricosus]
MSSPVTGARINSSPTNGKGGGTFMNMIICSIFTKKNFKMSCRFHIPYHGMRQQPRDHITDCVVIVGPTGTGKTDQIRDNYDLQDIYWKQHRPCRDGYTNQNVVIFDEF